MQRELVVSIDYGTSNSGSAYAFVVKKDARNGVRSKKQSEAVVEVVKDWPNIGAGRDSSDKVPSDITYNDRGQPSSYGFEASKSAEPLQWVKLLLEPDATPQVSPVSVVKAWRAYDVLSTTEGTVKVVSDYLTWLWTRIRESIVQKESLDTYEAYTLFQPPKLKVVLTVPASWSDRGKSYIQEAAIKAGIPEQSIRLLSEPEAAAIFGLKRQAEKGALVPGDCVIICDNGGGTVDVVAYQVRELEPLSLDQITDSEGSFCGSVCIDAEFQNQLRSELGNLYSKLNSAARTRIEDEFEYNIKRIYDLDNGQTYFIPVDGLEDNNMLRIRNGKMQVDDAVLSQAFDSITTPIMSLIDDQVAKVGNSGLIDSLKGILLVGGLSKSQYLCNRVRQQFLDTNGLKVWLPDNSWTAVVQGAVLCETSKAINSRLSPCNFGVPYLDAGEYTHDQYFRLRALGHNLQLEFVRFRHSRPGMGLVLETLANRLRVDKRRMVRWLVRKGQKVETSMSTEPYGLRIDDQPWLSKDEYCRIIVTLVRSDQRNAPDEYNENVRPHAEIDCRVPTTLRHDRSANLIQSEPHKAWHVPAKLVMYLDGAVISFRCKIKEEEVGVAQISYFSDRDSISSTQSDNSSTFVFPATFTHGRQQSDSSLGEINALTLSTINEAIASKYGLKKFASLDHPIHRGRASKSVPLYNQAHEIGVRTGRDKPRDKNLIELPTRYGKNRKWKPATDSRRSSTSAAPQSPTMAGALQ